MCTAAILRGRWIPICLAERAASQRRFQIRKLCDCDGTSRVHDSVLWVVAWHQVPSLLCLLWKFGDLL